MARKGGRRKKEMIWNLVVDGEWTREWGSRESDAGAQATQDRAVGADVFRRQGVVDCRDGQVSR